MRVATIGVSRRSNPFYSVCELLQLGILNHGGDDSTSNLRGFLASLECGLSIPTIIFCWFAVAGFDKSIWDILTGERNPYSVANPIRIPRLTIAFTLSVDGLMYVR
jgi:hypothetical protein